MTNNLLKFLMILFFSVQTSFAITIQHWSTSNGAQVYFYPSPQLPMVDVVVAFNVGSADDGNKFGLANLTANLLDQGTKTLSADQIANQLTNLGTELAVKATQDMSVISLRSLVKPSSLNASINLLSTLLSETNFSAAAFKRQQQEALEELKAKNQDPTQVAKRSFMRALYANDPYGHVVIGEEESVKQITMQDVVQFHQHYYGSHNAVIAIVGAVDKSQAEEIASRVVEKLPPGKAPLKFKSPSVPKAEKIQVKFPSTQTTIYMGQLGVTYEDKDFFPLMVANYTLGGSDVSNLYSIVRNREGLAYAVFSTFVPLKNIGPFIVFLQTKNSNVEQAVALIKKLTVDFIQQGPTESEIKAAKANLIGGFPLDIASNKDIAEYLVMIGIYHLPLNYLDTFPAAIKAVTMEQIKTALQNRIKPDNFIMVTVGGK